MRKVLKTITRLGPYKATVLVHGESGTGKELVARALHTLGPVPKGPFVTFNCSNLVESLAEAQLFGHVRGAFTDAREDALGYFRSANGGTLFLDEIGELPLRLQPKLLRAVETHEVQPVGSAQSYKVDIRLIAATNRDLRAMVKTGSFATTLLSAERDGDPGAAAARAARRDRGAGGAFHRALQPALRQTDYATCRAARSPRLHAYEWPGNVREFAHAIQCAVMLTDSDRINLQSLPEHLVHGWHEGDEAAVSERSSEFVDRRRNGSEDTVSIGSGRRRRYARTVFAR